MNYLIWSWLLGVQNFNFNSQRNFNYYDHPWNSVLIIIIPIDDIVKVNILKIGVDCQTAFMKLIIILNL